MSLQVVGSAASAGLSISQQHKLAFPVSEFEHLCQGHILGLHIQELHLLLSVFGEPTGGAAGAGMGLFPKEVSSH